MKSKIKIINVGKIEIKIDDSELVHIIKKQNRMETISEGYMWILKRLIKEKSNQLGRTGR